MFNTVKLVSIAVERNVGQQLRRLIQLVQVLIQRYEY